MPPLAVSEAHVRFSHKLRRAPYPHSAACLAGAVVAPSRDAAFAPPHALSAFEAAARIGRRRTDARRDPVVAFVAPPVGGGAVDPGPGRSAARSKPQTRHPRPVGAGEIGRAHV